MDFLSDLNLFLPEQQTRINKAISQALESNPDVRIGFDACAYCGKTLKGTKEDVPCKVCKRVWYCSKECRRQDSECHYSDDDDEQDQGKGHSAVICSLLKLCNIDEDVENEIINGVKKTTKVKKSETISEDERRAANDRISTEYESYPATLANVLMDAPCFQPILDKFMVKRRSKKTRQLDLDEKDYHLHNHSLTIHVIGASEESELWGDFKLDQTDAISAYTEALSELFSNLKGLRRINLAFIGPNCPLNDLHVVKTIQDNAEYPGDESKQHPAGKKRKRDEGHDSHRRKHQVIIRTHRHNYEYKHFQKKDVNNESSKMSKPPHLSKPDIVVFFNPGFTCPDYDWHQALKACQNQAKTKETPFLVATNTEYEAIADLQYLYQHGYITSLPPMVAQIVDEGHLDHDSNTFDEKSSIFFGENINAGNRVRQSGNMANDLYVKNQYIFGGHLNSANHTKNGTKSSTKNIDMMPVEKNCGDCKEKILSPNKKKRVTKTQSKTKKTNAALM